MIRRFALLQTFVAVARVGKMKQAAHELSLAPGAVSQRIRQLEETAGRRLFISDGVTFGSRSGVPAPRRNRCASRSAAILYGKDGHLRLISA
jgi:hypothetical protein